MRILVLSLLMMFPATASELPRELLLRCEGKVTSSFSNMVPDARDFTINVSLRDGLMSDVANSHMDMQCKPTGQVIECASSRVAELEMKGFSGSEKRELKAALSRQTGEYHLELKATTMSGKGGSGKATGGLLLRRYGHCQPIGAPLF